MESLAPMLPVGKEEEAWTFHLLLGEEGIRCRSLSPPQVRRLIIQERALLTGASRFNRALYLQDFRLHDEMDLDNPFVEIAVRGILYNIVCDSPSLPDWYSYVKPINCYLAYLCACVVLEVEYPLSVISGLNTLEQRNQIYIEGVRRVYEQAVEALPYWKEKAYKGPFTPRVPFTKNPFSISRNIPFPDWDLKKVSDELSLIGYYG